MPEPIDLLVIGAGAAGASAALAGRAVGARVVLVRAAPGASALAGGAWRGQPPDALVRALADVGHPLVTARGQLAHVSGTLEQADLAPPWHAAALPWPDAAVCGVVGLPGFNASFLARAWSTPPLPATRVELPDTPPGGWSPVALAAAVERAPERLGAAVGGRGRALGARRVILPALLGLERTRETWRTAQAAAGMELAEAVGGSPSLPGWRLDSALRRVLAAAGVEVVEGRVAGATAVGPGAHEAASAGGPPGRRLARVRLADGTELAPRAVVLATGKFIAGGIVAGPVLLEPALGLPVWLDRVGERFREATPLLTTELARSGAQPLLAAGVHTDASGRPVGESGEVLLVNVRAAGGVRQGLETAALGLGAAAADGWHMAISALEAA